jgi:hypothetical protein
MRSVIRKTRAFHESRGIRAESSRSALMIGDSLSKPAICGNCENFGQVFDADRKDRRAN